MTSIVFLQRIADLYDEFKQHDARQSDRLRRYRNIEAESAKLLAMLVRTQQSKRILEIGTSTGYSTLWLSTPPAAPRQAVLHIAAEVLRRSASRARRPRRRRRSAGCRRSDLPSLQPLLSTCGRAPQLHPWRWPNPMGVPGAAFRAIVA